jgi:putative cytoplasmic protein|nr:MAG TPA: cysteine peptidase [Caudoviricetes sp.]
MIYLALYHGHRGGTGWRVWAARFTDGLTRILTRGRYSHCELAVRLPETAGGQQYECYSASLRDGGVRMKVMPLPAAKWDLIALPDSVGGRLHGLWEETQGQGYDLPGAFGVVFGLPENRRRWFCSEWVGAALGLSESWRFSPNDLAAIFKGDCHV